MAEWHPRRLRTRAWKDIAVLYDQIREPWSAHVWIQRLCHHIAESRYRDLIFGATSMHTLLVGQHETLEWNCNMLRVEPTTAERITFSFHEKEFVKPPAWTCAPGAVVETFERFVRGVKWVSQAALS